MMEKIQTKPLTAAQQRQRDQKRRTWLRAGVQLFFFVSMPGAFVAGFSGVKQIFLHIGAGEVLTADSFTLSLLGLCGFTLLFDRFFCGYVCAFGSLGDAVWALSGLVQKKLFHRKKQLRLPERAVLLGQKVKYLLLAWLVALYVTRQEKMLTGASPWEVFSRLTALHLPPEGFGVGIGLLVLILLGMAVQPRFFCQFLCPMGAVFALLPTSYLAGAYLLDPFHELHLNGAAAGLCRLQQVAPDSFQRSRYYLEYYRETTILDELTYVVRPTPGLSLNLCLGPDRSSGRPFAAAEIAAARRLEPVVLALAERHWARLSEGTGQAAGRDVPAGVVAALAGQGIRLSPRQAEVALLVLRGHSSGSIALRLGVSAQTVKVFRRQLYARCGISSQAELFALMLPLLAAPQDRE